MLEEIKQQIIELLKDGGVSGEIELKKPPQPGMGDFSFGCFGKTEHLGINQIFELANKLNNFFIE